MVAALVFFFANTLPISVVIALTEGKSSAQSLVGMLFLVIPLLPGRRARWARWNRQQAPRGGKRRCLFCPLIYWVYRSYRLYLGGSKRRRNAWKSKSATSNKSHP